MKKILLLILSVIIFCQTVQAKKIPMKEQIIYANDTVDATFMIPISDFSGEILFIRLQHGIAYLRSVNKKIRLKPNQAKEVRFEYGSTTFRMVSVYNSLISVAVMDKDTTIFLKLDKDGDLKLFTCYYLHNGDIGSYPIVKKTDAPLMAPN